jgi:molybdenum cofactor synthesis domain-containing protein
MSFMIKNQHTAAIIIIGDEILSGNTQDENTRFIAQKLSDLGIELCEVRIVPDIENKIADAVNSLRKQYSYVFTTGGIGPTHDDITPASMAKAFNVPLVRDKEVEVLLRKRSNLADDVFVMADAPRGAVWIHDDSGPGFYIENVFVMAGVPSIVRSLFNKIEAMLVGGKKFISRAVTVFAGESAVRDILYNMQETFSSLQVGSYPFADSNKKWLTNIVVRGQNQLEIANAIKWLVKHLKDSAIEHKEVA